MKRRFYVKIELELHAITCPGVWLCPNGYLEVTIKSLGYFFKTGPMEPKFPILCHDEFIMEGYFKGITCYSELERTLGSENIEIILWQNGRRMAYFSGQLGQIMQPPVPQLKCYHNINVHVLMTASRNFPGIIAPKLELSARNIIQDHDSANKIQLSMFHHTDEMMSSASFIPCFPGQIYVTQQYHHQQNHTAILEYRRQKPVCHNRKDFKWHRNKININRNNKGNEDFNNQIQMNSNGGKIAHTTTTFKGSKGCGSLLEKTMKKSLFDECERVDSGLSYCNHHHERRSNSSSSAGSYFSKLSKEYPRNVDCCHDTCYHHNQHHHPHNDQNNLLNIDLFDDRIHSRDCKICQNYNEIFNDNKRL